MSPTVTVGSTAGRLVALAVVAAMILLPAAWVIWASMDTAAVRATNREQLALLDQILSRLGELEAEAAKAGGADAASIFLPGETSAIAGAALQRRIADSLAAAGGRLIETEFARVEPAAGEEARVDLRISFEAEIVSLQTILLELETGLPILILRSLDVRSEEEPAENTSPPLRISMLVAGYREVAE